MSVVVKDSETIAGYAMGPMEYEKSPWKREEESQRERLEDVMLLALKMEEGTLSQGT